MRVTIRREENKIGLFGRKTRFAVIAKLELTEEEEAIIHARNLYKQPLIHPEGETAPYSIGDFIKHQQTFSWDSFIQAQNYETELKRALAGLKELLTVGAAARPGESEVIEF